jgi:hypothetical protein
MPVDARSSPATRRMVFVDGRSRRYLEMGVSAEEFSAAHPDSEAGYTLRQRS